MSSEIRPSVGCVGSSGSNTAAYSSMPSSRFASPPRKGSRSGSGPASVSNRSAGTTSWTAPSIAPAMDTCASWTVSSEIAVCGAVPVAISDTAARNVAACPAISRAKSSSSWASSAASSDCAAPAVPPVSSDIEQPPSFEGTPERDLVCILQVSADRQPTGQPGDAQVHRLDEPREVGRRGLALEVGVRRQDQLSDDPVGQPRHELADPQVVRSDALDGTDRAAEHVIAASELPGPLDRDDVLRLLDDAEHGEVPAGIQA